MLEKDEKIKSFKIKNINLRAENEKLKNLIKSDNSFSKDHFIKNSSELLFDNSMEKDNMMTKKSLELNPIHQINSKERIKTKSKEELTDNVKKLTKVPKIIDKKLLDDEDNINDSNLKDITVMMKKILDDI